MVKHVSLLLCLWLSACGGNSQNKPAATDHGCTKDSFQLHIRQNSDLLQLQDASSVLLTVSGNLNNITVNKNYTLCKLVVSGSGNLIRIESQFSAQTSPEITISGNDNSIQVLDMQTIEVEDVGAANQIYRL